MMRLTGGGGQPLLRHPYQHHCESGARSPSSESVSAPPGPSGSQSGPSESLSESWGKGQETLGSDRCPGHFYLPPHLKGTSMVWTLHPFPTKGPNT